MPDYLDAKDRAVIVNALTTQADNPTVTSIPQIADMLVSSINKARSERPTQETAP